MKECSNVLFYCCVHLQAHSVSHPVKLPATHRATVQECDANAVDVIAKAGNKKYELHQQQK